MPAPARYKCACLYLGMESLLRDEDDEVPECKTLPVKYSTASLRTIVFFIVVSK